MQNRKSKQDNNQNFEKAKSDGDTNEKYAADRKRQAAEPLYLLRYE